MGNLDDGCVIVTGAGRGMVGRSPNALLAMGPRSSSSIATNSVSDPQWRNSANAASFTSPMSATPIGGSDRPVRARNLWTSERPDQQRRDRSHRTLP